MKTLVRTANEIESHSLFMDHKGTCAGLRAIMKRAKWKYSNGKYSDTVKNTTGTMLNGTIVWYERREDENGKYVQTMCINEEKLTEEETVIHENALRVARNLYFSA